MSACRCGSDVVEHSAWCELAPFTFTAKAAYVDSVEAGTKADIEAYLFFREHEEMTHEGALAATIDQAREGAACIAQIGSCWGGGCKH